VSPRGRFILDGPPRKAIEKLANESYAVACEDDLEKRAEKERQTLAAASRTGNSAAYPSALVKLAGERVRSSILAYAGALVDAYTTYKLPADAEADQSLRTAALQIAGGARSWALGERELYQRRTGKHVRDLGAHVDWEIRRAQHSALRKGMLILQQQRIKAGIGQGHRAFAFEPRHEEAAKLIQTFVSGARAKVRKSVESMRPGAQTLEKAAADLELEARIWAQNLHNALL